MSAIPIHGAEDWFCAEENAVVENRGADFGKIYLLNERGEEQGHMLWTAKSISHPHPELAPELVGRAIRALAASPWRPDYVPKP